MRTFDVCGPLPEVGTTLLEASAGTGKTYTIGALVTRYVAERGLPLDRMLVVTFGRTASLELRERVRAQLVEVERALADPAAARTATGELAALLATGPDHEVALRRKRLATALADFDAATIATTHQFCQQVLAGLGVAGDTEASATLVEDLDDLVAEVVDDLYVRANAGREAGEPAFDHATARRIGRTAIELAHARLEPADAAAGTAAGERYRFARAVREEVERRKRRLGVIGYDDLLSRVADALAAADAPARERMRSRWSIVLVDEFQDTDPVQWDVLHRAFAGHATLVLIGDPKQAIYAFRGGDVVAYLAAARTAEHQATLGRNWRSDRPLVDALHTILGGAELGDPAIVVREVSAAHEGSRLAGAVSTSPLRLRVLGRDRCGTTPSALIKIGSARTHVARDLAAEVAELLGSGATFGAKTLVAGDVAILVARHLQARIARNALAERGIPAVIAGAGSVYGTDAADDWLVLLEALEQPHRSVRTRAAALTPFLGRTAAELAVGGEALSDELGETLRRWADVFERRGVAAVLEVATSEYGMAGRLLGRVNGERRLTDLRHVGEGLYAAETESRLGLPALIDWLRRRRSEAADEAGITTDRSRRLDSDAAAVQVLTLHASKGLQFPVVYLPFAFDHWPGEPDVLSLHDADGRRVVDVGGKLGPGWSARAAKHTAEEAGEALRLLYVGLTRAQSQVVMWWAPTTNTPTSGLHRLLFGRADGSGGVPDRTDVPRDEDALDRLDALAARGGLVVESITSRPAPRSTVTSDQLVRLAAGEFEREVDLAWRRVSYTALSAPASDADHAGVGSEPEVGERDDEVVPAVAPGGEDGGSAALAVPSPMANFAGGAAFGTLVHAILERVDPQAEDLGAELREQSAEQLARRPLGIGPDELATALEAVITTPLGPLADDRALRDIPVSDRLTELDFELPLAGGDLPAAQHRPLVTVGDVARLARRHRHDDHLLDAYAERLESPALARQPLRGYLTGSLDAVLRISGPRYLVVDYKTNWLGDEAPLSSWHYRPAALTEVMVRSHYPLQAMLYTTALHRFLRWRQPGYDPSVHLGGVLYLFVRGMCGPETPVVDGQPSGVFAWLPSADFVTDLSALLDGRPS